MFTKRRAIFYISRNSLTVILENNILGLKLEFKGGEIANLEITDKQKLESEIKEFIHKNNLTPHEAYIVLSEDILFVRSEAYKSQAELNSKAQAFFDEIPLDPTEIVEKTVSFSPQLMMATFYGINRNLYEFTKEVLENLKWGVKYVIPEGFFSHNPTVEPSDIISKIEFHKLFEDLNDLDKLNKYSFLTRVSENINPDAIKSNNRFSFYKFLNLGKKAGSNNILSQSTHSASDTENTSFFSSKRNIVMIIVLVALMCILIYVLLNPDIFSSTK